MEGSNYAGSDGFRLNDGWSTKVNDPEFLAKLAEQKMP